MLMKSDAFPQGTVELPDEALILSMYIPDIDGDQYLYAMVWGKNRHKSPRRVHRVHHGSDSYPDVS